MAKLRNPTIEKLVKEGKTGFMPNPFSIEKTRELYYKRKIFEHSNYKAGYYSTKVILT